MIERPSRTSENLLPADFAHRVVARVEAIERRRRVRRRTVAVAACSILLAVAFLNRRNSVPPTATAGSPQSAPWSSDWTAISQSDPVAETAPSDTQTARPVALFFPDANSLTNFDSAYGETGWHSYDPWWNSTPGGS